MYRVLHSQQDGSMQRGVIVSFFHICLLQTGSSLSLFLSLSVAILIGTTTVTATIITATAITILHPPSPSIVGPTQTRARTKKCQKLCMKAYVSAPRMLPVANNTSPVVPRANVRFPGTPHRFKKYNIDEMANP